MCGGCGRAGIGDWLTPAVASRSAREIAARSINRLNRSAPAQVHAGASGFMVRYPTGRSVIAPTLTAVWDDLLRHGPVTLGQPRASSSPASAPVETASVTPEVPAGRLAIALTRRPDRLAEIWGATRVLAVHSHINGDHLTQTAEGPRVLTWARPEDAGTVLTSIAHSGVRLRTTVSAILHDGEGPPWATDVSGIEDTAWLCEILDGYTPTTATLPEMTLPEAAAWASGLVQTGATSGQRLTLSVAHGQAIIDAADGHGLSVRPGPTPTGNGQSR
jgi:hypothetical protein